MYIGDFEINSFIGCIECLLLAEVGSRDIQW